MRNLKWFARPDKFKNRLIMVILGVLIQGFGLSWIIEVSFGTDPCSAFTQGVISHVPLSFGTAQLLINIILFVVVFFADTGLIGFGTIANMVFIGYISDFCRFIYSKTLPAELFQNTTTRMIALISSCHVPKLHPINPLIPRFIALNGSTPNCESRKKDTHNPMNNIPSTIPMILFVFVIFYLTS